MKIAFDHQVFSNQRYGGISRYVCRLAEHLNNIEGVESKIIAPFHFNEYAAKLPSRVIFGIKVPRPPKSKQAFLFVNQVIYNQMLKRYKPDIVHDTYYWGQEKLSIAAARLVTCYDMVHEKFSDFFSKTDDVMKSKYKSLKRADHILCISESTRIDLLNIFDIPPDKVSVVYIGFDKLVRKQNLSIGTVKTTVSDRPYLLYVGARTNHKNFINFVKAYSNSKFLRSSFALVAFGGGKFSRHEKSLFERERLLPNAVVHVDGDDDVLANIYHDASAFIYPSLYEGFGIPPLEAFSCGCPVACSNTSSIPEVVGDAAVLFDPTNADDIAGAVTTLVSDRQVREDCVLRGRARTELFSWQKCAVQTSLIYRRFA